MPEVEQRHHKANSHNIGRGLVKGFLQVKQDYCAADFGSVTVVGEGTFLRIDGEPTIGFYIEDGTLQISLRLFSEKDELLLEIERNHWISGDPLPWDIEADWQTITLRERVRHISVSINAKAIPLQLRAKMFRSGRRVEIDQDEVVMEYKASRTKLILSEIAIVGVVFDLDTTQWSFGPRPENPHAAFVSWPQRRQRLWMARDEWRRIVAERAQSGHATNSNANSPAE